MAGRKKLENKQKFVFDEGDVVQGNVGSGRSSVQHRLVLARGESMGVVGQLVQQKVRHPTAAFINNISLLSGGKELGALHLEDSSPRSSAGGCGLQATDDQDLSALQPQGGSAGPGSKKWGSQASRHQGLPALQ